ncbi:TPA: hypothetical protein UL242_002490 [Clostridioides difficile]|uniref:hypothetical protein n=1 Tax=Clostridioides difficile TaxID=1496 RepID=UPI000BB17932|nr:hypothetical protein [Clostridioides difficile]EGT3642427.1 hypothetical protein [Clostridioides difficile]MBH7167646.1 hypothetical protein [Clostridioides difficile]MBY1346156.1 hypothetical protein [Clostridioides difficile]MCW0772811.1 hypothetical protein [Clostridioides difficile]MCW0912288.1 hypothetical protein [Clostridioides difficile]
MRKRVIIFFILSIIIGVTIGCIVKDYTGNKSNESTKVVEDNLSKQFQKVLNSEIKKVKDEYEVKLNEEKKKDKSDSSSVVFNKQMIKLRQLVSKYYKNNDKEALYLAVDGTGNINKLLLTYNKEHNICVEDNKQDIENTYSIEHTQKIDVNNENNISDSITFKILNRGEDTFNINNHQLFIEYIQILMNKDLSNKDKSALNVQVNMNLSELSSVEDLNTYLYNKDSLKINNFIFSVKKIEDKELDLKGIEYSINSNTEKQ